MMPGAILGLYEVCIRRIDMNAHQGCHPRIGAIDVCPFIPLEGQGVNSKETVKHLQAMCDHLAKEITRSFGLPVYLYGLSAQTSSVPMDKHQKMDPPNRAELSFLRKGGFEALAEKMTNPHFAPDFGPVRPHPTAGATVLGVRDFLVAYNITLDSKDLKVAKLGAKYMRALPGVKALGWFIPEYDCVQISCNITQTNHASIVDVYDEAEKFAQGQSILVKGSELIGLIPLHNLQLAYHRAQLNSDCLSFEQFIPSLVDRLGLSLHGMFETQKRVLEWML
jgi:glutamate formiminotransferase